MPEQFFFFSKLLIIDYTQYENKTVIKKLTVGLLVN